MTPRRSSSIAPLAAAPVLTAFCTLALTVSTPTPAWAASPALPAGAKILPTGQVTSLTNPGTPLTTPVDGRLRGPDFTARVTGVGWPTAAGTAPNPYVAGRGHRLVVFSLSISEEAGNVGIMASPDKTVTATVSFGATQAPAPVDLTSIGDQIGGSAEPVTSATAVGTGTAIFVASEPAGTGDGALTLTEGSFSQTFNLWTLQRVAPYPSVLYRDPNSQSVPASPSAGATISITNPADGYSAPASVDVHRSDLTAFNPDGLNTPPPSPGDAYLAVTFTSAVAQLTPADPNWGHYFAGITPLPGSAITFSAPGQPASVATAVDVISPSNQVGDTGDDGLLDATYVFVVPATTTTGSLAIAGAPTTGTEYVGFTGIRNGPLSVGGPTTLPLAFLALPPVATQPKPAWIGAPLPATASAASQSGAGAGSTPKSGSGGGLPVWLAVVILVVVLAGLIAAQQLLRRRTDSGKPAVEHPDPHPNPPTTDGPVTEGQATSALVNGAPPPTRDATQPVPDNQPDGNAAPIPIVLGGDSDLVVRVLGPVEVTGWLIPPARAATTQLCCYLAMHQGHATTSDRLLLDLWPTESDRQEVTRKTLHNYLSGLRRGVGIERFPEAVNTGGYRFTGVTTDWNRFGQLVSEADGLTGQEADQARTAALTLVRDVPFKDAPSPAYDWVHTESLATSITVAIVAVAHRLATDLLAQGEVTRAEWAVRQGLRASPTEEALWLDLARAVTTNADPSAERRLWRDAAATLGPEATERLRHAVDQDATHPHRATSPLR
ncbi:MAG: AfsR/SARP family transcriptional regulator [Acidimicrobiales bacterium]